MLPRREGRAHIIIFYFYRYEFGAAIFIAWAGAFLDIMGGGMLAASCPKGKSSPKYPKSSRPPSSSREYVWAMAAVHKLEKIIMTNRASVEVSLLSWSQICLDFNFFYCVWLRMEQTVKISVLGKILLLLLYSSPPQKKRSLLFSFFFLISTKFIFSYFKPCYWCEFGKRGFFPSVFLIS